MKPLEQIREEFKNWFAVQSSPLGRLSELDVDRVLTLFLSQIEADREALRESLKAIRIEPTVAIQILDRVREREPYTVLSSEEIAYNLGVSDSIDLIPKKQ